MKYVGWKRNTQAGAIVRIMAAVAALALVAFSAPRASAATRALAAAPPDAVVAIDIPDLPVLLSSDGATSYGAIMREESVKNFIDSGVPALTRLRDDFSARTGTSLGDVAGYCRGEAAVIVTSAPDAIAVVEVGKDPKAFQQFVAARAAQFGAAWTNVPVGEFTAKAAPFEGGRMAYVFAGDYFVFSSSLSVLEKFVPALAKAGASDLPAGLSLSSLVNAETTPPEVVAVVDFDGISRAVLPLLPPEAASVYDALGFNNLQTCCYTSRLKAPGFDDTILLRFRGKRSGLFAALAESKMSGAIFDKMAPADAISAGWMCVDFSSIAGTAAALKGLLPPKPRAEFDAFTADVEAKSGVNFRRDLLSCLGRNVVTYRAAPSQLMGLGLTSPLGQSVEFVDLTDAAKFQKSIDALWKYAAAKGEPAALSDALSSASQMAFPSQAPPAEKAAPSSQSSLGASRPAPAAKQTVFFETEDFGKSKIYELRIVVSPLIQIVPSMAIKGRWLVVGEDAQTVKNVLGAPDVLPRTLSDNEDYKSSIRRVRPGNAGVSYNDTKTVFNSLYPLVTLALPLAASELGGEMLVNQALLPPAGAVSQHLFGSATTISVSDDEITIDSYGSIGLARSAWIGGVIGAAAWSEYEAKSASEHPAGPRPAPGKSAAPPNS